MSGPDDLARPDSMTRRTALRSSLAAVPAAAAIGAASPAPRAEPDSRRGSPKRFAMKKSINQWAFPYPSRMNLRECLQLAKDAGFEGIELNYDLENDLSPKSTSDRYKAIRAMAKEIGIAISGVCSFLYWPYSLTDNDPSRRARGMELAALMIRAAHDLGAENLLVVPGAVTIPWRADHEIVPLDACDRRAREAIAKLIPLADEMGVSINIENIFFNGYLMTPGEMAAFVDGFKSDRVRVHFDSGNIMLFVLTKMHAIWYDAYILNGGFDHADGLFLSPIQQRPARRRRFHPSPVQERGRLVQASRRPA